MRQRRRDHCTIDFDDTQCLAAVSVTTRRSELPTFMPLPRLNVDTSRFRWEVRRVEHYVLYAKYSESPLPFVLYGGDLLAQLIRSRRTAMWALSMLRAYIDECVEAAGEMHARNKPLSSQGAPAAPASALADGVGVQSGPSAAALNDPLLTAALRRFICADVLNAVVEAATHSFTDGNAWMFATCATSLLTMVCVSDPIRTLLQRECDLFGCVNRLLRTTDAACRAAPDVELKAEMHDYAVSALCHALKFFYKSPAGQAELMSSGVADTLVALLAAPSTRSVRLSCLDMLMKFDMRLHRSLLAVDGLLPRLAELVSCDDRAVQAKAVTLAHSIDAAEHTVGADRHALLSHIVDALTAVGRTGGEPLLRCLRLCRHLARHNERLVKLGLLTRIAELIDRWCAHAPTMHLLLAVLRAYALGLDAQPSAEEQLALARATGDTGASGGAVKIVGVAAYNVLYDANTLYAPAPLPVDSAAADAPALAASSYHHFGTHASQLPAPGPLQRLVWPPAASAWPIAGPTSRSHLERRDDLLRALGLATAAARAERQQAWREALEAHSTAEQLLESVLGHDPTLAARLRRHRRQSNTHVATHTMHESERGDADDNGDDGADADENDHHETTTTTTRPPPRRPPPQPQQQC
jgi:hypothetical protein